MISWTKAGSIERAAGLYMTVRLNHAEIMGNGSLSLTRKKCQEQEPWDSHHRVA
jgi:hypothetical protein